MTAHDRQALWRVFASQITITNGSAKRARFPSNGQTLFVSEDFHQTKPTHAPSCCCHLPNAKGSLSLSSCCGPLLASGRCMTEAQNIPTLFFDRDRNHPQSNGFKIEKRPPHQIFRVNKKKASAHSGGWTARNWKLSECVRASFYEAPDCPKTE